MIHNLVYKKQQIRYVADNKRSNKAFIIITVKEQIEALITDQMCITQHYETWKSEYEV